ncbi:hypothetical protein COX95_04145 [bacterium CG_4_10_14_0_2_um_filter_33_32]|nr:MAG: hypothetical protein AUJ93_01460 [bacterium CG2_30_33_46]PIR67496.1 MAG: hypothetical protein COU50_03070 [bacterium CG10_big_fil_rev_8_21_14_0_10_33_18]PIU77014.1 MAG: hypothetical protein COS74_01130 [bacterium CG06_land_8_20_14_3_00_33_50]PIW81749.1 MAG: hypothetical protein COZ97_00055 [bacterium CG_4_8_14_3_um_filter_33_28]PIY85829.1 MAG: hypothetical protein COY76_00030 [bacterium CG_4_10_14_0_8_um_filter_33_57]PIZ85460.1 MAG: hypothetical protein COX95_04145 [bacterium CG_4_10_1
MDTAIIFLNEYKEVVPPEKAKFQTLGDLVAVKEGDQCVFVIRAEHENILDVANYVYEDYCSIKKKERDCDSVLGAGRIAYGYQGNDQLISVCNGTNICGFEEMPEELFNSLIDLLYQQFFGIEIITHP